MFQLKIEDKVFLNQIDQKIDAIKELTSPKVIEEIAKAAFVISGEKFMNAVDREAVRNPQAFHHVYEWGRLGSPDGRLFYLERKRILNGNLEIESNFLPSRVPVPRDSARFSKGPSTLSSKNIFRFKAKVMEEGRQVSFITSKVTPLSGTEDGGFVAPGTRINILNPGGIATKNAFAQFMVDWYVANLNEVVYQSGILERIESEVARVVERKSVSKTDIRNIVATISNSISGGKDEIR